MSRDEADRQFRVAKQTLAIHCALRDRYKRLATVTSITLLASSTVFCATTFIGDESFDAVGLRPSAARLVLGIASVAAFAASLCLLVLDWSGKASSHGEASRLWSDVVKEFRDLRSDDGAWSEEARERLSAIYWQTSEAACEIPDKRFTELKGAYLRKVEVSKLRSKYPGCPKFVMMAWMMLRDTRGFLDSVRQLPGSDDGNKDTEAEAEGARRSLPQSEGDS